MRKLLVFAMFLLLASVAMAQRKFETKWHCGKPTTEKSVDVGDVAGHSYGVAQGECNAVSSGNGEKTGVFTEVQEMWKTSFTVRGHFVVTTDNGEKIYDTYESVGDPVKKTVSEKWKTAGGTGKHKDARGSGTCAGKLQRDGSSDWDCSGTTRPPNSEGTLPNLHRYISSQIATESLRYPALPKCLHRCTTQLWRKYENQLEADGSKLGRVSGDFRSSLWTGPQRSSRSRRPHPHSGPRSRS